MTTATFAVAATVLLAAPVSASTSRADMSPAFLRSSTPKVVTLDVRSGKVLAVRRVAGNGVSQNIVVANGPCRTGEAVYDPKVPYNQFCFSGSRGTQAGPWSNRVGYRSFAYTVSACWTQACGPIIGPNSSAVFGGGLTSTGTSFTIH